jgi:hypothetical protein
MGQSVRQFAFLMLALFASAAAQAKHLPPRQVYSVEKAAAFIRGSTLIVTAEGKAQGAVWQRPYLRLKGDWKPEDTTLNVEFVATPPLPDTRMMNVLQPLSATLRTSLPHYGIKQVNVMTENNSLTVPITR